MRADRAEAKKTEAVDWMEDTTLRNQALIKLLKTYARVWFVFGIFFSLFRLRSLLICFVFLFTMPRRNVCVQRPRALSSNMKQREKRVRHKFDPRLRRQLVNVNSYNPIFLYTKPIWTTEWNFFSVIKINWIQCFFIQILGRNLLLFVWILYFESILLLIFSLNAKLIVWVYVDHLLSPFSFDFD